MGEAMLFRSRHMEMCRWRILDNFLWCPMRFKPDSQAVELLAHIFLCDRERWMSEMRSQHLVGILAYAITMLICVKTFSKRIPGRDLESFQCCGQRTVFGGLDPILECGYFCKRFGLNTNLLCCTADWSQM